MAATITAKEVEDLRGMELMYIFPDSMMTGDWDRQECKAYVAAADIERGITIRGESPNSNVEEDVDLCCLNIDNASEMEFMPWLIQLAENIRAGVRDRRDLNTLTQGGLGTMGQCAFK